MKHKHKTWLRNAARVVLGLLLISPILGVFGIFPEPTADMYHNQEAFLFIQSLMNNAGYISIIMALVFAVALYFIIKNYMAAAALLIAPIVVNIVAFHAFLDGGLFTGGAVMGNVLLLLTAYFLWEQRDVYKKLLVR